MFGTRTKALRDISVSDIFKISSISDFLEMYIFLYSVVYLMINGDVNGFFRLHLLPAENKRFSAIRKCNLSECQMIKMLNQEVCL